jgi:hypothetical protein
MSAYNSYSILSPGRCDSAKPCHCRTAAVLSGR